MSQAALRYMWTLQNPREGFQGWVSPSAPPTGVKPPLFPEVRVHTPWPGATETSWLGRGEGVRNQVQEKVKEEVKMQ